MGHEVSRLPVARPAEEFLVETLADEVLVYDQINHQAHCLTPAAAIVWKLCDGGKVANARAALTAAGHAEALEVVIDQLTRAKLVRPVVTTVDKSRRRMFSATAVAAGVVLASPVIYSIISPSVAEAASACQAKTQACSVANPCCKGLRCLSGFCQ